MGSSLHIIAVNSGHSGYCYFPTVSHLKRLLSLSDPYETCHADAPHARKSPPHCSRHTNKAKRAKVPGLLSRIQNTLFPSTRSEDLLKELSYCVCCGIEKLHQHKAPDVFRKWEALLWKEYLRANGLHGAYNLREGWISSPDTVQQVQNLVTQPQISGFTNVPWNSYSRPHITSPGLSPMLGFSSLSGPSPSTPAPARSNIDKTSASSHGSGPPTSSRGGLWVSNRIRNSTVDRLQRNAISVYRDPPEIASNCVPNSQNSLSRTSTSSTGRSPLSDLDANASIPRPTARSISKDEQANNLHLSSNRSVPAQLAPEHFSLMDSALPTGDRNLSTSGFTNPVRVAHGSDLQPNQDQSSASEFDEIIFTPHSSQADSVRGDDLGKGPNADSASQDLAPASSHGVTNGDSEVSDDEAGEPLKTLFQYGQQCVAVSNDTGSSVVENEPDGGQTFEDAVNDLLALLSRLHPDGHRSNNESGTLRSPSCSLMNLQQRPTPPAKLLPFYSRTSRAQYRELLFLLPKWVCPRLNRPGWIYGFRRPSLPGHVKIGVATISPLPNSRVRDSRHPVDRRLATWERCSDPVEEVFRYEIPCAAPRIESLIHASLRDNRRIETGCTCRTRKGHDEWFEIDERAARGMVELWQMFSRTEPYDRRGRLTNSWCDIAVKDRATPGTVADWLAKLKGELRAVRPS